MATHDLHWMVVVGVLLTVVGAAAALGFVALGFTHPLWIFVPIGVLSYGQGLALPECHRHCGEPRPATRGRGLEPDRVPAAVDRGGLRAVDGALPDGHGAADAHFLRGGVRGWTRVVYVFPRVEAGKARRVVAG